MFGKKKHEPVEPEVVDTQRQELSLAVQNAAERVIEQIKPQITAGYRGFLVDVRTEEMVTVNYSHEDCVVDGIPDTSVATFHIEDTLDSVKDMDERRDALFPPFSGKGVGNPVVVAEVGNRALVLLCAVKGHPLNTLTLEDVVFEHLYRLVFSRPGHTPKNPDAIRGDL